MADIKWIDPTEFQDEGFLQEANRQFFHPHGLALAVTRVSEETYTFAITAEQYDRLVALAADDTDLTAVIDDAGHYEPGQSYFQGVWDDRDDAEGVLFGSWCGHDLEKVERVAAEREQHREAREALFGKGSDVEHLGYEYQEPSDD